MFTQNKDWELHRCISAISNRLYYCYSTFRAIRSAAHAFSVNREEQLLYLNSSRQNSKAKTSIDIRNEASVHPELFSISLGSLYASLRKFVNVLYVFFFCWKILALSTPPQYWSFQQILMRTVERIRFPSTCPSLGSVCGKQPSGHSNNNPPPLDRIGRRRKIRTSSSLRTAP